MKNTLIALIALAVPFTAFAGDKEVLPEPTPAPILFVGAGAEHMDQYDTEYYTLKGGARFDITETLSYALFGEVGFATLNWKDETVEIVPVTFNADLRYDITPRLFTYIGAGAGTMYWNNLPAADGNSWTLVGQAFGGIGYKLTDSIEISAQGRYLVSAKDFDDWTYGVNVTWAF